MSEYKKGKYSFSLAPALVLVGKEIVEERKNQVEGFIRELEDYSIILRDLAEEEVSLDLRNELLNIAMYISENAEIYKANADEYIGKIQNIDTQIGKIVNKMDKKEIIFADKFPLLYFAKEYGLSYYAAFPGCAEDTEPSARTIAFLIDKINEDKINKVYYLELSSKAVANTICEDTGAKAYEFNSCHNITEKQFQSGVTYVDLMTKNLEVLKK